MNLPAPTVLDRNWYLLAEVTGYYGKEKSPCSMGIYLGIERQKQYIYHVFLNGNEAYYGHTSTGDPAGRTLDVRAALSQAWSNYQVSPDKWRIAENTEANIKTPTHKEVFLPCLNQLRDIVAKHKNGEPVIPLPSVFHTFHRAFFNAHDADILPIP